MTDTMPTTVVDRELQGWRLADDGHYRRGDSSEPVSIERVMSKWAPLRSLGPAPEADLREARDALIIGGKHAAASVLAALTITVAELSEAFRARGADSPNDRALAALTAGDPGSDRSALLIEAVMIGQRVSEVPSIVCAYTRDTLAEIMVGWIRGPGPFVEIGGALSLLVTQVANADGPGGWARVADSWLHPGELANREAAVCYELLYHGSR
jgi:hypothetical protein